MTGAAHPSVVARLARLSPDQREAATAPPGPVLCVAPAGSGKTTTLVARVAWLVDGGADPATIAAITFNKRAAEELVERVDAALAPLGLRPGAIRVRTFHALGREILLAAGRPVEPLVDRDRLLRVAPAGADAAWRRRMDDAISRRKLDRDGWTAHLASLPPGEAGALTDDVAAYEGAVRATGGLDFDDLVARSLALLRTDPGVLAGWRARCAHLLVDEVQDVDASQLALALEIAAPANRILFVGDDDQSIYGWRLADVRRVLGLAARLPGLRRVDLVTNRRCPPVVVDRAARLVAYNRERFVKRVEAAPDARGRLTLVPEGPDEVATLEDVVASWPGDGTHAVLARTNRELLPALAVALDLAIPFRAERLPELASDPRVDVLLAAAAGTDARLPPGARVLAGARALMGTGTRAGAQAGAGTGTGAGALATARTQTAAGSRASAVQDPAAEDVGPAGTDDADGLGESAPFAEVVAAVLGWIARHGSLEATAAAVAAARERLALLRKDDAALTLATAHATKGLEFDDVAVLGMSAGRFPSARSLADAADPARALEEERRLAYVAWTRARRSLALLYDPASPSPFLAEAFDAWEIPVQAQTGGRGDARGPPSPPRPREVRRSSPSGGGDVLGRRRARPESIDEPQEDEAGAQGEEADAEREDRLCEVRVRRADERARQVPEILLVRRLQPVHLRDDVQNRGDHEEDRLQPEGVHVFVRVAEQLDRDRPEEDHDRERARDREPDLQVEVGEQHDQAQPEDDDEQGVTQEHVAQPPDVAAESQRDRAQEPQDVGSREEHRQGERPQDREDRCDGEDHPPSSPVGQGGREVVGREHGGEDHRATPAGPGSGRLIEVSRRL